MCLLFCAPHAIISTQGQFHAGGGCQPAPSYIKRHLKTIKEQEAYTHTKKRPADCSTLPADFSVLFYIYSLKLKTTFSFLFKSVCCDKHQKSWTSIKILFNHFKIKTSQNGGGNKNSISHTLDVGKVQGSILGPILYAIFVAPFFLSCQYDQVC